MAHQHYAKVFILYQENYESSLDMFIIWDKIIADQLNCEQVVTIGYTQTGFLRR